MGAPSTDQLVAAEDEVLVAPPMVPVSPELQALANSYGVATEYFDQSKELRQISAVTVQAVLSAFGVDASTPTSCLTALEERRLAHWRRMLPPVFVTPQSAHAVTWVHVRDGDPVGMWIELEDGGIRHDLLQVENNSPAEEVDGRLVGEASFQLPRDLPLGWHQLKAESRGKRASVPLVVAPDRLELPKSLQNRHGWGFAVQLYSLRSRRSWGIGDLSDLSDLAAWSGHQLGADFVQINPVHASEPTAPMAPSPYLPVTRRFANPLYVRVEDVAEFAYLDDDDRSLIRRIGAEAAGNNDSADLLDRDSCWQAKREALEIVARIERSPGRQAEYDAFRKAEGDGLRDFATWCALVERYGQDFEDWPWELQDPASPAVKIERQRLADRVEFFCWLQWITDTQLAHAQAVAKSSGMRLGILHDLAVGVHPHGADAWALQDVLARGVTVGAPPDMYNQMGQNWSQPPWRPDSLADHAFLPFRDMLRTVLRNAGALRLDHVLGLFRLWWVPEGMPAYAGTFVKYDHEALVNILVLEAHRAGAVLIGEDLGTVEKWVHQLLDDRGILGTSVLWFERDGEVIKPVEQWRGSTMVSVTVHDLPPTAAYLAGAHVDLRDDLGLLARPYELEWSEYQQEIHAWRAHLEQRGLLRPGARIPEMVVALHRLVASSPCRLIAIALPDAVGDLQSQNQPGTDQEYPNWRLPLSDSEGHAVLLEDLMKSEYLRRLVAAVGG
ncbi:MAG TPA: 4-alpha-glucanotransferase [Actinomycetota bacterium]|nr:4-alpha-glucanotransferase [Actinomycetota bacterium]